MSTRSTTHFADGDHTEAIIYRHSDGYPEGAGADLLKFLEEVAALPDSRFSDPSYLAAKYVVYLAGKFNNSWNRAEGVVKNKSPLDFLSVGVCSEDPVDIEYRYTVECSAVANSIGLPLVRCTAIGWGDEPDTTMLLQDALEEANTV